MSCPAVSAASADGEPGQQGQPTSPSSGFAFNNNPGPTANPGNIPSNNVIGGGIAGVASTASGSGIKVINDRQKFKEWEFVYDMTKDKTTALGAQNQQLQNQQQQNQLLQPGRRLPSSGQ